MFIYPQVTLNLNGMQNMASQIESEIRTQFLDHNMDVTPYVNVISQPDMSEFSKAGKVAIYELDLNFLPVMGKYNKCIGIYLEKKMHPALAMKILMTE